MLLHNFGFVFVKLKARKSVCWLSAAVAKLHYVEVLRVIKGSGAALPKSPAEVVTDGWPVSWRFCHIILPTWILALPWGSL